MVKSSCSVIAALDWLIQYAVVYPLAMMMLLIVAVFWTGQMLVTIESVQQRDMSSGLQGPERTQC
jgi:hypothetical protein